MGLKAQKERQQEIYQQVAQMISALSSPVRLKLIHFLSQAPLTVEVLAQKCEQSVANTSMHLRKMLSEKILRVETQGQKRLYSLHPALYHFFEESLNFAQALNSQLTLTDEFNSPFSLKETKEKFEAGELVFVDVRPEEEAHMERDHIDDSRIIFIPAESLKRDLKKLPKKKIILVICRGRFCVLSLEMVKALREENFEAYRFPHSWHKLSQLLSKKERSIK